MEWCVSGTGEPLDRGGEQAGGCGVSCTRRILSVQQTYRHSSVRPSSGGGVPGVPGISQPPGILEHRQTEDAECGARRHERVRGNENVRGAATVK